MASTTRQSFDPAARINECVQLAQRGDLAGARSLAEDTLKSEPSDPVPFLAFLGMVTARLGDVAASKRYLSRAQKLRPDDVTIACNLIALLLDDGDLEGAYGVATKRLAAADPSLRVARYRAFVAQQLEQFDEAVGEYERVVAAHPQDFECWNNLGNARAGAGDFAGALAALDRALALDPNAAPTRLNRASTLLSLDREDEAIAGFEAIVRDFPQDTHALNELYVTHKFAMRQEEALDALERAIARNPDSADLHIKHGVELGLIRRVDESEAAYRKALAIDPLELDAYLGIAIKYEHNNEEDRFAPLIAEARAAGIADKDLAFIEALELRRQKEFAAALDKLDAVPENVEPVRTVHLRATLLDRLGRHDEAFAQFMAANTLLAEMPSDPLGRAAELREQLTDEIAMLTPDWRDSLQDIEIDDGRSDPVFLLGFPRSGTTLLDTILMGHPQTVVMEEQPPLNTVETEIGGLSALPDMDAAAVAHARSRYFEEVDTLQPVPPGTLLVDKSPLFLYRLPLIKRLFPNAKIILALRHPCDVVLSCLMSNFRLNPGMANFLRLQDAASFYDLAFGHWQTSRDLFDVDVQEVRYERLVDDVEAEVRPLVDWLGLEWDDTVLDHTATARSRGLITTASYSQVTEPIYRRAAGRWEKYRDQLEPAFPTLLPWCDRFGYVVSGSEP